MHVCDYLLACDMEMDPPAGYPFTSWDSGYGDLHAVPDLGTPSPFSNNNINGIAITGDTLFVSTPNAIYLARLSLGLKPWTSITGVFPLSAIDVRGIACDGRTLLAVVSGLNSSGGSITGSFRLDPGSATWTGENPDVTPLGRQVRRLRDDNGVILATTLAGTYIRVSAGNWTLFPNSPATDNGVAAALEVSAIIVPLLTTLAPPDTLVFGSTGGRLLERSLPQWSSRTPPGPVGNNCRALAWSDCTLYASYNGEGRHD